MADINLVRIDKREPLHITGMQFNGAIVQVELLETGDIWVITNDASLIICERKTPGDLLGSIKDGRIFNQVARMRELTPWAYLIITGELSTSEKNNVIIGHNETGWNYDAVQGALLTIQEMGCHVMHLKNDYQLKAGLERLARRNREAVPIEPARKPYVLSSAENLLTGFPGIGHDKAKNLINILGSPARAISYLTRLGLNTVPGFADGTKQTVRRTLGLKEDEILLVLDALTVEWNDLESTL